MLDALLSINSLYALLTFIAGGGGVTIWNAWNEHKQAKTNADVLNLKTPVEVEAIQVTGMETLVKSLQSDNEVLRKDRDYWRKQHDDMRLEVNRLMVELEKQEQKNKELREYIDRLSASLSSAEEHSPAVQEGRADLIE